MTRFRMIILSKTGYFYIKRVKATILIKSYTLKISKLITECQSKHKTVIQGARKVHSLQYTVEYDIREPGTFRNVGASGVVYPNTRLNS